jgi:hypothetical protein
MHPMHPLLFDAIVAFGFAGVLFAGYYYVIRSPPWWLVTIAVLALLASTALLVASAVVDFKSSPIRRQLAPTMLMSFGSAWALFVVLRRDYRFRTGARQKGAAVRARKAGVGARAIRQAAASTRRACVAWRAASKD